MKTRIKGPKRLPGEFVVLALASAVVLAVVASRVVTGPRFELEVVDGRIEERGARPLGTRAGAPLPAIGDSPAAREAVRRERASMLAHVLTLTAARGLLEGRPFATLEGLLADVAARDLVPPGIEPGAHAGVFAAGSDRMYVRYRPAPVGVEVIAVGTTTIRADGAPLIVRVTAEEGAALYEYLRDRSSRIETPEPFASRAELAAAFWVPETIIEPAMPEGERAAIIRAAATGTAVPDAVVRESGAPR
jgi:hypothetical protein